MDKLQELLVLSASRHHRLCPRQVLGVRMGMLAGKIFSLDLPQADKRLFAFVECDGCGLGGIGAATGCCVERRTMRVLDYGKLAATFVDTQTGKAVRISPHPDSRKNAVLAHPDSPDHWQTQLEAYQTLPDEKLLIAEPVKLTVSMDEILSHPDLRVNCSVCGEEIMNKRELMVGGKPFCQTCARESYFTRENGIAAP